MIEKERNEIAIFRYGVISPILHSEKMEQKKYFEEMAAKTFEVPHTGRKKYKWKTFKHWLTIYRKYKIEGLTPKERNDKGQSRSINEQLGNTIKELKETYFYLTCSNFYRLLIDQDRLPFPPINEGTLRKYLNDNNLNSYQCTPTARKKYEARFVNDLWISDFMHGPKNLFGSNSKVYLCVIIDDHSRMIVGAKFFFRENTQTLEVVLKSAILKFGRPNKLYADNGAPFKAHSILWGCAKIEIAFIHSKPYDSPSRGKVERFNRTVRQKFLNVLPQHEIKSIDHLNVLFQEWLDKDYHKEVHSGIGERPIDRYFEGIKKINIKTISAGELDLCFYQTIKRRVKNDATVPINTITYEVPPKYIGRTVEIRFPTGNSTDLSIYEDNIPVYSLRKVDVHKNAETPLGIRFSTSKLNKEDH